MANTISPQKFRPVIFSGPMVRAILEGRKTQTRRIVKGRNIEHFNFLGGGPEVDETESDLGFGFYRDIDRVDDDKQAYRYTGYLAWCGEYPEEGSVEISCRYGVPGDRLWVRETFGLGSENNVNHPSDEQIFYRATDPGWDENKTGFRWRPSIYMPRWASRITLEITKVRVERLQEISEEDAIAEGVGHGFVMNTGWPDYQHIEKSGHCTLTQDSARMSYATLWDSINGKSAWEKNPWVWVIDFCPVTEEKV